MKREHALPLLAWTALCGLYFLTILVGSARLPTSDFSEQFHAYAVFQAREMTQGRLPLWSPHSYAGTRLVGDPQAAVFYLPRWLAIALSSPWGFIFYALEVEAIANIWLAGVLPTPSPFQSSARPYLLSWLPSSLASAVT